MAREPDECNALPTVRLLKEFREGDEVAFGHLYRRYFDRLRALVHLRLGPQLRAKLESIDIVQEAFMSGLKDAKGFTYRTEGAFFHWLCKLAENRIRDQAEYFAAKKRDADRERPLAILQPSVDSIAGPIKQLATSTTPASKAARNELLFRLTAAMDLLPEHQREAILLVRYEGLSMAEAGEVLAKTPEATRKLVARAMIALGRSLGVLDAQ